MKALIPPRSSCFSAVLSDRLAIIISLKRSTSLTSFNIPSTSSGIFLLSLISKNEDLHSIGTLATILQMLKLPDGTIKVLVEGVKRAKIEGFSQADDYTEVKVSEFALESGQDTGVIGFFSQCLKHQSRLESLIEFYPVAFVH
jgi:ATP-dependent Lon protease